MIHTHLAYTSRSWCLFFEIEAARSSEDAIILRLFRPTTIYLLVPALHIYGTHNPLAYDMEFPRGNSFDAVHAFDPPTFSESLFVDVAISDWNAAVTTNRSTEVKWFRI